MLWLMLFGLEHSLAAATVLETERLQFLRLFLDNEQHSLAVTCGVPNQ